MIAPVEIGDGAVEIAAVAQRQAAVVERQALLGSSLIAWSKSASAWSTSPLRAIGKAAVVVGQRVVRVELDRLRLIGDGAVDVALVGIGVAAVVVAPPDRPD